MPQGPGAWGGTGHGQDTEGLPMWSQLTPESRDLWAWEPSETAFVLHKQSDVKNVIYFYSHSLHLLKSRRDRGQRQTPVNWSWGERILSFLCHAVWVGFLEARQLWVFVFPFLDKNSYLVFQIFLAASPTPFNLHLVFPKSRIYF